jgi:transcriptional regulator with XRE-family HTH domain
MSGSSRIGVCPKCRAPLAEALRGTSAADPVASAIRNLDYEIWIAEQLGGYIAYQVNNSVGDDFDYNEVLQFWFRKFEIQNSVASAELLGVSQSAISIWLSTGAIPKLRVTLGLCWVFGLTLLEFLHRRLPASHDGKLRPPAEVKVRQNSVFRRRPIDRPELGAKLTEILRDNLYALLPFEEICEKKLDRGGFVVRQCFPDLAQSISKRFLANRRLLAEIRREQFCSAIKTVSRFLHSRGITPNHKTLQQYLDRPTRLRCDWAIAALREVRAELGYEDDGEQLLLTV